VPRFADVPKLEVHLVDRRDLPSAGGGEITIIALAPAIGNAISAGGVRLRSMPLCLPPGGVALPDFSPTPFEGIKPLPGWETLPLVPHCNLRY
jgi:hypothetical protein